MATPSNLNVSARLPVALIDRVDAAISETGSLRARGLKTRTDVIELGVRRVLAEVEA